LRELHGDIRKMYDDASSSFSTATAEASHWQARCGELHARLAEAQSSLEGFQQQHTALREQAGLALREQLCKLNSCWQSRFDAAAMQHRQLEKAHQEQQQLLHYYQRGMANDSWLAMQGDGRQQLARLVAAEPLVQMYRNFWALKSSSLLRMWLQHPDLTREQFEGIYKNDDLVCPYGQTACCRGAGQESAERKADDIKALNGIRDLVLGYGQFGGKQ